MSAVIFRPLHSYKLQLNVAITVKKFMYFWLIVEFKLSVLVDISSSTSN